MSILYYSLTLPHNPKRRGRCSGSHCPVTALKYLRSNNWGKKNAKYAWKLAFFKFGFAPGPREELKYIGKIICCFFLLSFFISLWRVWCGIILLESQPSLVEVLRNAARTRRQHVVSGAENVRRNKMSHVCVCLCGCMFRINPGSKGRWYKQQKRKSKHDIVVRMQREAKRDSKKDAFPLPMLSKACTLRHFCRCLWREL